MENLIVQSLEVPLVSLIVELFLIDLKVAQGAHYLGPLYVAVPI